MAVDRWVQVLHQRRAIIWIFLFLLVHTKIIPVSAAPPDLASDLTVEAITTTGAKVRWTRTPATTPATIDNYEVSITPNPNGGIRFQPGPTITGDSANPETTISGLTAGVEYTASVRTVKGTDKGTPKNATFNAKPNPVPNTSLSVTNPQSTTATASWSAPNSPGTFTEYIVSISPNTGGATTVSPVASGTTTSSLTNLIAGNQYTVGVKTKSGMSDSDVVTKTFTTKPDKVDSTSLTVGNTATTTTATLTWDAVTTPFLTYEITISPTAGGAKANPASVAKGTTTAALESLTPGTEYTVTITTKNGGLESDPATMKFRTKPPNLGGSVVIEAKEMTTATAKWTKPATGTFTNYMITMTPEETGIATPTVTPSTVPSSVQSPSVALAGLVAGQVYTVSVLTNWDGVDGTATTEKFRTKPDKVSNIQIDPLATTTATVKWTPLTLDAKYTAIYKYQVDIEPPGPTVSPGEVPHPGTSTSVTGMTPGTTYKVKVTTEAGYGTLVVMGDPVEREFTAKPTPVTQNTIVFKNVATKTATATWDKVSVGVSSEYKVGISPTGPTISQNPVPGSTDPPTTALTNLVPGTEYTLTVITVSGTTESTPASATFRTKPLPVTGVTLTQNGNKITITWIAGVGSTQSSYKIRYHAIFLNPISAWNDVTLNHPTLTTDISITPGEKYEVEVTAISGDKSSDAAQDNLVTAPSPPASVSVNNAAATTTSIEVTWTAPTPTSYFIKYIIRYTKEGTTTTNQVEATSTELKKTIPGLEAGVKYAVQVFTESKESKMSETSADTDGTVKPNCDVVVTDLSTETNKLKARFTASTLVFTNYKFVIANSPKPATKTPPKGTPSTELVYEQGVTPGNKYTLTASCVSNDIESDVKDYFLSSVPAPVTQVDSTSDFDYVLMTIHKPEGTVASVDISCSGPSPGTKNGCTYDKSCFFSTDIICNVKFDNLDSFEDYTFTITVTSNQKKSAPKVVTVKTVHGRPGPASDFKATAQSPTSLKLEWKTPVDPNGEITKYVVEYTGTYKANPSLNLPMDKKNVTFDGLDPNAGSYVKTLEGLKGGYVYELLLHGKTTYREAGENAATSVTLPTAAPTLVVGAKPPQPLDRKNATSIMAVFSKAFNESNGPILYYSVIVAENKDDDTTLSNPKPDDTIPTWSQVKGISENWPPYMPIRHCDIFDQPKNCQGSPVISRKKRSTSGDTVVIMIGVQDCKNMGIGDYCNGALKPGTFYQIRLRGYTGENKYHDTPYSERIQTSTMHIEPVPTAAGADPGIAIGLSVTSVIILLIASVVTVVVVARRRKQNKGSKNEQRPQAEVTVENPAFTPIYDVITEPAPVPERETEVMSMVTRYLPNADSKSRAKLQKIFTRLGVTQVKELTYIKENDIVPPLTAIEARMFIEKLQEHERTAVQHDEFYSNKPRVPNDHTRAKPTADGRHTDALYVNVGGGISMNAAASGKPESANDTTDGYASLQDFAQPDQNLYAKLGGAVKK